jgi:hypothetical protein
MEEIFESKLSDREMIDYLYYAVRSKPSIKEEEGTIAGFFFSHKRVIFIHN